MTTFGSILPPLLALASACGQSTIRDSNTRGYRHDNVSGVVTSSCDLLHEGTDCAPNIASGQKAVESKKQTLAICFLDAD
jgi:hypothetical protein